MELFIASINVFVLFFKKGSGMGVGWIYSLITG